MSGAEGISGSRQRSFTDEELAALRNDESSSAIINKARRHAGYKEPDVAVRGDDRTLDRVLEEKKTHIGVGKTVSTAVHAIELAEALGVGTGAVHAAGRAGPLVLGVAVFAATQVALYEMERTKMDMRDGATRDQLHAAIVMKLDVPAGFKEAEIKRLNVAVTNQSAAKKIADQLEMTDKPLLATLQLHCDQGMHAARDMHESGQSKEAFLAARPAIAKRYQADAAFKNGFDALVWAKADSPATYSAQLAALTSRDGRYAQAQVQYRL